MAERDCCTNDERKVNGFAIIDLPFSFAIAFNVEPHFVHMQLQATPFLTLST